MRAVELIGLTLFVAAAAILLYALRSRHRARTRARDDEAWQQAFNRVGGAQRRFDGYDQAQAERMVRQNKQDWRRRYGRHRTKQKSTGQPAEVVTLASRRKAAR